MCRTVIPPHSPAGVARAPKPAGKMATSSSHDLQQNEAYWDRVRSVQAACSTGPRVVIDCHYYQASVPYALVGAYGIDPTALAAAASAATATSGRRQPPSKPCDTVFEWHVDDEPVSSVCTLFCLS